MKDWLVLAFRNLLRNKRRSAVTILAATLGFAAVNVFGGFTTYMFTNLRDAFIYAGGNGHLQIYKKGYREHASSDPANYLVPAEIYEKLKALAAEDPRIILAAGTMELTGQIDTGDAYNIFVSKAFQPSHRNAFYENAKTLGEGRAFLEDGESLTDEDPYAIGVAGGVKDTLNLELGADIVLMARTTDGQINVVDAVVKNTFASTNSGMSDKLILMPLELAQELYQTDSVGTVSILLENRRDMGAIQPLIEEALGDALPDYQITRWDEESDMYKLTRTMFDMIFGIVFVILIIIVTMSVMNTMGMAIVERTTEIGTLRALGLKRFGVIRLFGMEGAMLGIMGALLGTTIATGISLFILWRDPMWTPPTVGREVPLEIQLSPNYLFTTSLFLIVLTFAAAVIPARKAARQGIVQSLGHV